MQRWIERAMFDLEDSVGAMLDDVRDGVAVRWSEDERLENEKVQGALEQICL